MQWTQTQIDNFSDHLTMITNSQTNENSKTNHQQTYQFWNITFQQNGNINQKQDKNQLMNVEWHT